MRKIEDEVQNTVAECWSVTTDIRAILKYSDDVSRDLLSLTDVYNNKFKKLMDDVDSLIDELHNIRDTYNELKPVFDKKDSVVDDKDLFGNPIDKIIEELWTPPAEWPYRQVKDNVVKFGEKKDES